MKIFNMKELLKICNLSSSQQISSFLNIDKKLPVIKEYIIYLKQNNFIEDKKIICIENNSKYKWLYEDLLFNDSRSLRSIEQGVYFEDLWSARQLIITEEEHKKNIINFNLQLDNINEYINQNLTFLKCPFTGYKNDSRIISHYIKHMFRLNPILLAEDILEYNNIKQTCAFCYKQFKLKYNYGINYKKKLTESYFCDECKSHTHHSSLRANSITTHIKDKPSIFYVENFYNLICPFCNEKLNNHRHFAKHLGKHSLTIIKYLKEYCADIKSKKCLYCDNDVTIVGEYRNYYEQKYFNTLNTIFYDYDYIKNFSLFKDTCKNCHNKSIINRCKKIYSYLEIRRDEIDDSILDLFEVIRHNYNNLNDYVHDINRLFNFIKENNEISIQYYNGFRYWSYSKLENKIIKFIIDKFKPDTLYTNWDIFDVIGNITYIEDDIEHVYIPDIYFTKNNKKYLMEVKSEYILTQNYKNNILKFKSAIQFCFENNIRFLIYIGEYGILSLEKIEEMFNDQ